MALYFRNGTNRTVNVAIGYSWENCPDGDNWAKKTGKALGTQKLTV